MCSWCRGWGDGQLGDKTSCSYASASPVFEAACLQCGSSALLAPVEDL